MSMTVSHGGTNGAVGVIAGVRVLLQVSRLEGGEVL